EVSDQRVSGLTGAVQYCGDVPPVELEAAYYAQRQRPAAG
ncbi:hypothetical protein Q628_02155, partial [Mycobacterium tuberculosis OFXR-18]